MTTRTSARLRVGLVGAIILLGFGLRAWGLGWGLADANVSKRPHPDEWAVYWLFQWFGRNGNLNPCPREQTACFFDWGAVYPYAAYAVHGAIEPVLRLLPAGSFGPHPDVRFVHAVLSARLLSALLSTATIVIAYRLASIAYGWSAGVLAATLVALSGLLIQLAHFGTPDATTGFLLALSLLAIVGAHRVPDQNHFLLAGASVGVAAGSEYHMGILAIPFLCSWLLVDNRQTRWLVGACVAAVGAFVLLNPYVVVEFPAFLDALLHGVRMRTVDNRLQYQSRFDAYGPWWLYVVRYPLGYGVGFAVAIWMLAGAAVALARRRPADLILLCWILPYFLLVTVSPAKFMRYSAPLLVPLAVLAGRAASDALKRSAWGRRAVIVSLGTFALLYSGTYDAAYAGLFASQDPRQIVTEWMVDRAARTSSVAFEDFPDGLVNLPYFISDAGFKPCFSPDNRSQLLRTAYVIVDDYSLDESQPGTVSDLRPFRARLQGGKAYRLVRTVHHTPTFLGIRFPIDASPHDWRYPTHNIRVYELRDRSRRTSSSCYGTMQAALLQLNPPKTP